MTFPSRFSMTGRFFLAAIAFLPTTTVLAVPQCTALGFNNFPQGKGNKLYLFFPATATAYPQFGPVGTPTNPAQPFDVSRLQSYTGVGTAEDLRSAIVDVVTDTYCEFNVEVVATSTLPSSALPRRNVVRSPSTSPGYGPGPIRRPAGDRGAPSMAPSPPSSAGRSPSATRPRTRRATTTGSCTPTRWYRRERERSTNDTS